MKKIPTFQLLIIFAGVITASSIIFFGGIKNKAINPVYREYNRPRVICDRSSDTSKSVISSWPKYINDELGYSYQYPIELNGRVNLEVFPEKDSSHRKTFEQFAENKWTQEDSLNKENNRRAVFPPATLTPIEKIIFNGNPAYRYTIDLFGDKNFKAYVLIQDKNEKIFIVSYPDDGCEGQQMFSTLVLDSNLVLKKAQPSDWKTYKNSDFGFEFSYPGNIFISVKNDYKDKWIESVAWLESRRGLMEVELVFSTYDMGHQLKEDINKKLIKIDGKDAYTSTAAEGGGQLRAVLIPLRNYVTLSIVFASDESHNQLYPLVSDEDLQEDILRTFKFSK